MNMWTYQIIDNATNQILAQDSGYEYEADAEEQACRQVAKAKLANVSILTFQEWVDL